MIAMATVVVVVFALHTIQAKSVRCVFLDLTDSNVWTHNHS